MYFIYILTTSPWRCAACSSGTSTWPICGVCVVCSVFQWDTHLASLWGLGGVHCVAVGHPFDQAGWDQLSLSGSQSACLIYFLNYLRLNQNSTAPLYNLSPSATLSLRKGRTSRLGRHRLKNNTDQCKLHTGTRDEWEIEKQRAKKSHRCPGSSWWTGRWDRRRCWRWSWHRWSCLPRWDTTARTPAQRSEEPLHSDKWPPRWWWSRTELWNQTSIFFFLPVTNWR